MSEHFGAVEADFQSYYGLDLRQVLWGPMRYGVRRIRSLVSGLPHDSAVTRASLYGGQAWSNGDELLATLIEMTDHGNRMYFGAHTKKGTQVWDPVEINRPWKEAAEERRPRRKATVSEMKNVFGDDIIHDYTPGPREGET